MVRLGPKAPRQLWTAARFDGSPIRTPPPPWPARQHRQAKPSRMPIKPRTSYPVHVWLGALWNTSVCPINCRRREAITAWHHRRSELLYRAGFYPPGQLGGFALPSLETASRCPSFGCGITIGPR